MYEENENSQTVVIEQPPIDLQRFCDTEPSQYTIQSPWVFNGWRYATDGIIGVRFPAPGEADTPAGTLTVELKIQERRFPRGYIVFEDFPQCADRLIHRVDRRPSCDDCLGTGWRPQECRDCEGVGHDCPDGVTPEGGPTPCPRCNGKGKVFDGNGDRCRFCAGRKMVYENQYIGNREIAGKYLSILADLPDLRIHLAGDERSGLAFVSGRLQGVLMPLVME